MYPHIMYPTTKYIRHKIYLVTKYIQSQNVTIFNFFDYQKEKFAKLTSLWYFLLPVEH